MHTPYLYDCVYEQERAQAKLKAEASKQLKKQTKKALSVGVKREIALIRSNPDSEDLLRQDCKCDAHIPYIAPLPPTSCVTRPRLGTYRS